MVTCGWNGILVTQDVCIHTIYIIPKQYVFCDLSFPAFKKIIPCLDYRLYDYDQMTHSAVKNFWFVYEASFGYYIDNEPCSQECGDVKPK